MTTFTINSSQAELLKKELDSITAVPIHMMATIPNGIDTGYPINNHSSTFAGSTMKMDLPAGTKFFTFEELSKNQLRKLLGQKAMVRGVNK